MPTFIDRYIEQGRQRGVEQGIAQGRQQCEAAVLLRQIERKFGPPMEFVRSRVEVQSYLDPQQQGSMAAWGEAELRSARAQIRDQLGRWRSLGDGPAGG